MWKADSWPVCSHPMPGKQCRNSKEGQRKKENLLRFWPASESKTQGGKKRNRYPFQKGDQSQAKVSCGCSALGVHRDVGEVGILGRKPAVSH